MIRGSRARGFPAPTRRRKEETINSYVKLSENRRVSSVSLTLEESMPEKGGATHKQGKSSKHNQKRQNQNEKQQRQQSEEKWPIDELASDRS
jgi:hypothetical protein